MGTCPFNYNGWLFHICHPSAFNSNNISLSSVAFSKSRSLAACFISFSILAIVFSRSFFVIFLGTSVRCCSLVSSVSTVALITSCIFLLIVVGVMLYFSLYSFWMERRRSVSDRKSTRLNSSHVSISYLVLLSLHDALPIFLFLY